MKLYVDGELVGEKSDWDINSQVPNAPGGGDLKVGNVSADFPEFDGGPYFTGDIDEVRVYGCVLSAEEVAVLALGLGGEPEQVPALAAWGQVFLLSLFLGGGALLLRGRRWRFREA